jgi:hypothetical protein
MRVLGVILVTVSIMTSCATTIDCQIGDSALKRNKLISQETYNHVLDILFPSR